MKIYETKENLLTLAISFQVKIKYNEIHILLCSYLNIWLWNFSRPEDDGQIQENSHLFSSYFLPHILHPYILHRS